MSFVSILAISFALAMDAFAASITSGLCIDDLKHKNALKIALFFGGFQAGMTLLGCALSFRFKSYIQSIDHWIAFVLLAILGGRMIYEAFKEDEEEKRDPLNIKVLTLMAIATSIDALIIGIGFAFLNVDLMSASLSIGIITFVLSFLGVYIGRKFGEIFNKKAEICGGAILIIIGMKILLEHTGVM